jgi:hypothetical protein
LGLKSLTKQMITQDVKIICALSPAGRGVDCKTFMHMVVNKSAIRLVYLPVATTQAAALAKTYFKNVVVSNPWFDLVQTDEKWAISVSCHVM